MKASTVIIGLLAIAVAVLIYIYVIPSHGNVDDRAKHKIDSLNTLIIKLNKSEKRLDSLTNVYRDSITVLDHELIINQKELTKQREQYGKKIKTTRSYTPTQLDSFFTSKYNCK
jgi:hypothetical protein